MKKNEEKYILKNNEKILILFSIKKKKFFSTFVFY